MGPGPLASWGNRGAFAHPSTGKNPLGCQEETREGGHEMSEERPRHPQEPAEGSEEAVEASGAERARNGEGPAEDAPEEAPQPEHPEEPAEGGEEDVEAAGAERAGDDG